LFSFVNHVNQIAGDIKNTSKKYNEGVKVG